MIFRLWNTNYARWLLVFLKDMAKLPEVHDAFMEGMCVVQRGDKKCYCGSSRYGSSYTYMYIIKPQRASIFGEYTHMQLRLSALWIAYGIGTCKDLPIRHISQIKCLDLNIVKCCPSSMLSQGAM